LVRIGNAVQAVGLVGMLIAVYAGERIFFSVGSEPPLQLLFKLLRDIRIATAHGLSTKWGRAYHGDATEHREQSQVEGTHDSIMAVCWRIVRKPNAKDGTRYSYERLKNVNLEGV
jgi:hypothetical protein